MFYQEQYGSGNSSYLQAGTDIPFYANANAYAGGQGTGIPPWYEQVSIETPGFGGSPGQPIPPEYAEKMNTPRSPAPGFLQEYLRKNGIPIKQAGASFNLNTPYVPGKDFTGVPNADNPAMKEKLRNRLLKNPSGSEQLPSFLVRGA